MERVIRERLALVVPLVVIRDDCISTTLGLDPVEPTTLHEQAGRGDGGLPILLRRVLLEHQAKLRGLLPSGLPISSEVMRFYVLRAGVLAVYVGQLFQLLDVVIYPYAGA